MTALATEAPADVTSSSACPCPLRPIETAVVGLDRAGIAHAAVLSTIPDCSVVGVVDHRPAARRNLKGIGCPAPAFDSLQKLLKETRPGAVILCGPSPRRAEAAHLALESGAAVLIDRPPASSSAEVSELARLAAELGQPLVFSHPILYHPVFAVAQQAIAAGALGAPHQVRSSIYASRVFSLRQKQMVVGASSGGVLAQVAADLVFLLVWCFGAPSRVRATAVSLYGAIEDELHAMMTLPSGAEVGFDSSWSVPGYPRPATVVELEGERGKLLACDDALEVDLIAPDGGFPAGHTRLGHAALPHAARFDLGGEELYLQDAAFLAWATGGAAPPNRGETALQVCAVIDALYASARSGGAPADVLS